MTQAPNLAEGKYVAAPPWIKDLPALSHYTQGGKTKLPFAFEKSTPQSDVVLQFVLTRVLRRAQGYGFARSSKTNLKDRLSRVTKVGGKRIAGPWATIVSRVLNIDCKVG